MDSATPLELIPERCRERGITVQALTDHNEVWGAQKLQKLVEEWNQTSDWALTIIVGEEILTREGEIIGLFLKEKIAAGLSPEETLVEIKRQGGLALLPHGFDALKWSRLHPDARMRIAAQLDIVETFNAHISHPRYNRAAATWSKMQGFITSAGSDAHRLVEIGDAWVEVPRQPITTPTELLSALKQGTPTGIWVNPITPQFYRWLDRVQR